MRSEVDFLKERGLNRKPDNAAPASPSARASFEDYGTSLKEFENLIDRIRSYQGQPLRSDVAVGVLQLITSAAHCATRIREKAERLGAYPNAFIRLDSGVAYFGDIAVVASEAHGARMAALQAIETKFGKRHGAEAARPSILDDHEGFKGGHLRQKHVAQSMSDFQSRFLREGKKTLSSFIDDFHAEEAVTRAIELASEKVRAAKEGQKLKIPINELHVIGYVKKRGSLPSLTSSGYLIIIKDSSHPSGFRIVTAALGEQPT